MSYMTEANAIAATLRGKAKPPGLRAPDGEPTARNLDVLAYARDFFAENDQLPTIKCIREHFGWTSDNAADAHVQALIRHGKLERNVLGKLRFAREKGGAK
jgi:SOS-response transcriptional repressor LexA